MTLSIEPFSQISELTFYPDQAVGVDNHPPIKLDKRPWIVVNTIAAAGGKFVPKQELDTALSGFNLDPFTPQEISLLRRMLAAPVSGDKQSHSVIEMGGPEHRPHFWIDAEVKLSAAKRGRKAKTDEEFGILKWVRGHEQPPIAARIEPLFAAAKPISAAYPRWAITGAIKRAVSLNPDPFREIVDKIGPYTLREFHRDRVTRFLQGFQGDWDQSFNHLLEQIKNDTVYATNPKTTHRALRQGFNIMLGFEEYDTHYLGTNLRNFGNYYQAREAVRQAIVHHMEIWIQLPEVVRTVLRQFFLEGGRGNESVIANGLGLNEATVSRYANAGHNFIKAKTGEGSLGKSLETALKKTAILLDGTIYPLLTSILEKGVKQTGGRKNSRTNQTQYYPTTGQVSDYWRRRARSLGIDSTKTSKSLVPTSRAELTTANSIPDHTLDQLGSRVRFLAIAFLRDSDMAEDVVQRVLEELLSSGPEIDDAELRRLTLKYARQESKGRFRERDWDEAALIPTPRLHSPYQTEHIVLAKEEHLQVVSALKTLLPDERYVLVASYAEGMSPEEIAKTRGLRIEDVPVLLARAAQMFKEHYPT